MTVTALRPGRTRALVQRPKRKMHLASIGTGDTDWIGMCGRYIPADGAAFTIHDAMTVGEEHADDLCADCRSLIALVTWAIGNALAATELRKAAR